ncbi:competence protein CoiA [Mucilaginibacter sp. L3T2-6]|uniref:competence protein CoiA n=1 Tax=Mucilaginibacter sp. L3T2-6 TaxID=3062491 RepID=UPI0026751638|nr:competence protein CoiA family protein [Mucilaginibacter sp. L3T2-6]MDO3641495.1 competence protein CoiA family protein [Mucilaginibacter sp. L3T2-6]MDV6213744.1 competence protein CoiA family protein [Mucilaginibacter sp. L3T2-6]
MRFALIDDQRVEARSGLKGLCPGCAQPVIAKCGTQRSHHWAHRDDMKCDFWREPETEWHRSWKNNFPTEWQEVILPDQQTGEKHIADICTDYGLVIEFQHSHIHPQERTSRENFYRNMVWVVDGTRLKNDYKRLLKGKDNGRALKPGVFLIEFPDECFPLMWLGSPAPIIFDFQDSDSTADPTDMRNYLYCLFPVRVGPSVVLTVWVRNDFINMTINGDWLLWVSRSMDELIQYNKDIQYHNERQRQVQTNIAFAKFTRRAAPYRRGRRF